jgi:hypothetical protein
MSHFLHWDKPDYCHCSFQHVHRGSWYESSPWWWRQHAPLKRRSTFNEEHGSTSQKILSFNLTSDKRLFAPIFLSPIQMVLPGAVLCFVLLHHRAWVIILYLIILAVYSQVNNSQILKLWNMQRSVDHQHISWSSVNLLGFYAVLKIFILQMPWFRRCNTSSNIF